MGEVVRFNKKGTPLSNWATTVHYMHKQYGKAKAYAWIKKHVPEQFHHIMTQVINNA